MVSDLGEGSLVNFDGLSIHQFTDGHDTPTGGS